MVNIAKDFEMLNTRYQVETYENWKEVAKHMPALRFKSDYEVTMLPPFAGAMVRFSVKYQDKSVSVYLDTLGRLGYEQSPYWEAYCKTAEEPVRFDMVDTNGLMEYIEKTLEG